MLHGSHQTRCSACCCTWTSKILPLVFTILLIVVISFGNSVTLAVTVRTKHFHTPQGYLKVSLAVADLAVGIFLVPLTVYADLSLLINGSPPNSPMSAFHPCRFIGPVFACCTSVSITTIFFLSMERSIAVLKPLHREAVITRRRTSILITFSWLGRFFLALSPFNYLQQRDSARTQAVQQDVQFYAESWCISNPGVGHTPTVPHFRFHPPDGHSGHQRPVTPPCDSTWPDPRFLTSALWERPPWPGSDAAVLPFFWILMTNSYCNVIIYGVRDQKCRHRAHQLLVPPRRT